jgi:beta-lactamase superfamily II metal-dependent hydrolase
MHLTAFRSGKGDCLLLEGGTSGLILVDGGVPESYRDHVAPAMAALRKKKRKLDLVYVSHIDEDHIGGVLEMLNQEMAWRVFEVQSTLPGKHPKKPQVPRPPEIRKIWHNAFQEQVRADPGDLEEMLAAMASILSGSAIGEVQEIARKQGELSSSVKQAIQLSRRIGAKQLKIPLNPDADGKLMMRRANQGPITVGSMKLTILGPTEADLRELHKEWKKWLDKHQPQLKNIRTKAAKDESLLGNTDVSGLMAGLALQAETFGDPGSVTPPNLASLTLFVKEGNQTILLTGDARGDQIVDGLKKTGIMPESGKLHVDVLKVQHHGAENNIDPAFCDAVTADHYVFCGDGDSHNPDPRVCDLIVTRRLAGEGSAPFKFWFNCSEAIQDRESLAEHLIKVEEKVKDLRKRAKGRLKAKFLTTGNSLRII